MSGQRRWRRTTAGLHVPGGGSLAIWGPDADPVTFDDSTAGGRLQINPGDNWQTRLNAAGAGGQVFVMPGAYNPTNGVVPCNVLNGQTIVAARDPDGTKQVFVDGQDIGYLFRGTTGINNVTIRGFDITNFLPTLNQTAPVQPYQGNAELSAGNDWDVRFMRIHDTEHMCLRLGGLRMKARANELIRASRLAVGGRGAHNAEFAYNEMSDNNPVAASPGWEAGGLKMVLSDDVHIHHNLSRRNYGADIWFDIAMLRGVVEDNYGEDNQFESVFIEISFGPIKVRRNTSVRGGLPGWFPQAPIMVSATPDVEVYDNILIDCVQGIVGMQQYRLEEGGRGMTVAGFHRLSDLNVHDNEMHFVPGTSGPRNQTGLAVNAVPEDATAPNIWTGRNIHFEANKYWGPAVWAWQDAVRDWAAWRGYGHDDTGTWIPT